MKFFPLLLSIMLLSAGLPAIIIQYDDGSSEDYCQAGANGWEVAEWFYPPFYPCTLTAIMFYPYNMNALYWKVWDDDGPPGPPGEPLTILRSGTHYPTTTMNWITINVVPPLVISSGAFYIGWTEYAPAYANGFDMTPPHYNQCCFHYEFLGMWFWSLLSDPMIGMYGDLLIRAVVGSMVLVNENETESRTRKISISPNPFNSVCEINAPDAQSIGIFDLNGREISRFSSEKARWVPQSEIPSGLYFIVADYGNEVFKATAVLAK